MWFRIIIEECNSYDKLFKGHIITKHISECEIRVIFKIEERSARVILQQHSICSLFDD